MKTSNPVALASALLLASCFVHPKVEKPCDSSVAGWLEYQYRGDPDPPGIRLIWSGDMPRNQWAASSFIGTYGAPKTAEGLFQVFHGEGPFKGVCAVRARFRSGELNGVATFWSNNGVVIEQKMFAQNKLLEHRKIGPWLDNAQDQVPPDGVYTGLAYPPSPRGVCYVARQWVCQGGKSVQQLEKGPWKDPEPGFWKCFQGEIVCFPSEAGVDFWLDGKRLLEGDKIKLARERVGVFKGVRTTNSDDLLVVGEDGEPFDLGRIGRHGYSRP